MKNAGITRRSVLRAGNVLAAGSAISSLAWLTGCGTSASPGLTGTSSAGAGSGGSTGGGGSTGSQCLEVTNVTRGPYFIDYFYDPNITDNVVDPSITPRSDIRIDTKSTGAVSAGLPLYLTITVGANSDAGCSAIAGAEVFLWQCNAQGLFSGVTMNDTDLTAQNFLRGFQYTDLNGQVLFTTIYPGWYSGSAVHIHMKVRIFDTNRNITTEATTQLFFDDQATNSVYAANSAYRRDTPRDTLTPADPAYAEQDPPLLITLSGSPTSGYSAAIAVAVDLGTIYGG